MSRRNRAKFAFTALLVAFALLIVLTALGYTPEARLLPLMVGVAAIVMGVIALIDEVRPIKLLRGLDGLSGLMASAEQSSEETPAQESGETPRKTGFTHILVWLVGFFVVVYLVGFNIAIGLFALLFLRIYGRMGWLRCIVMTAIIFGFVFLMFEIFMKVGLFKGVLFGEMVPPL